MSKFADRLQRSAWQRRDHRRQAEAEQQSRLRPAPHDIRRGARRWLRSRRLAAWIVIMGGGLYMTIEAVSLAPLGVAWAAALIVHGLLPVRLAALLAADGYTLDGDPDGAVRGTEIEDIAHAMGAEIEESEDGQLHIRMSGYEEDER